MRNIIVGTDWWTDCDDAVALRILARAHKKGEICIKGIGINGCMEHSVTSVEGFLCIEDVYDIPLGIDLDGTDFGGNPPYQKRLADYAKKYRSNKDAENAVRLYRRILAESTEPVEIIEIGYLQVISAVLASGGDDISPMTGLQLIAEKVPKIWVMAGKWDENPGKENNFARNERARIAGKCFCETCPVEVTFLGWEVGFDVITGDALQKDDVLYDVLVDHGSEKGRMSWDPMLVLLALTGDEKKAGYGVVRGKARVDESDGTNFFCEDACGLHKYVIKTEDNIYYKNMINSMIA